MIHHRLFFVFSPLVNPFPGFTGSFLAGFYFGNQRRQTSVMRSTLFFSLAFICIFAGSASATLIEDLIGEVKLAPVDITLDTPDAATAIDGTLHVVGSHNGQAARQLVDLTTGIVGAVEFFDSLSSANGPTGDPTGFIRDVIQTANGEVLYVGQSAGQIGNSQPTSWTETNNPLGGIAPTGGQVGGTNLAASSSGNFVGNHGGAIVGTHGNLPEYLTGAPGALSAVDISRDGGFIAGDLLWESDGNGSYDVLNTTGFDYSSSGATPTWQAVAIDPVVGEAIFAGSYFDLNAFEDRVGFWREDGTFLFSAAAGSQFRDFEVYDGELVAAVVADDDTYLYAISDFSFLNLESILGFKSLISDDGLFVGSVGFLATGANGTFVSSRVARGDGGTEVPEPASCLLLASALGAGFRFRKKN